MRSGPETRPIARNGSLNRGVTQAVPVDLPRSLDPKLVEFLDGLAELIARDLHRKGWGMAGSEGDSLAMMVMEKHRDIAVLMSMGARRRQVWALFALHGLLIGALGTLVGLVTAIGLLLVASADARFVARASAHLGDVIGWACTINEPNVIGVMGYTKGDYPPGVKDDLVRHLAVNEAMVRAHRLAVDAEGAEEGKSQRALMREPLDQCESQSESEEGAEA